MIGSPMDSTAFAPPASDYSVVTYDPCGIGNSSREATTQDVTPGQQADDVHRLLSVLGSEPAHVFGAAAEPSSGSRWSPPTPARSTSPVTTADSWPSPASAAACWTRYSPKRPEPADTLQAHTSPLAAASQHGNASACASAAARHSCPGDRRQIWSIHAPSDGSATTQHTRPSSASRQYTAKPRSLMVRDQPDLGMGAHSRPIGRRQAHLRRDFVHGD